MNKAHDAFRTISEVATELGVPKHVLRFWESKFPHIKPMKRGGGRRYYRPEDMQLLSGIRQLLHADRYTIKGVQKILREQGVEAVKRAGDSNAASSPTRQQPTTPPEASGKRSRATAKKKELGKAGQVAAKALTNQERIAQIDNLIHELEACRALLVEGRPTAKTRKTTTRKSRSARSA